MNKIIYSIGVCLIVANANAQFVNSTDFYVSNGAVVSFNMDVVNEGKLTNEGKVHFQRNLDNLNSVRSSGIAVFDGNGQQEVKSKNELVFQNIQIENDVRFDAAVRVEKNLDFRKGIIESSDKNPLTFASGAAHSGMSDFSHIRGVVKKEGNDSFDFPLGDGENLKTFNIAKNVDNQVLTAAYLYRSPLNISGQVSDNLQSINENEYWTLKSESVKGSTKVGVNAQSGMEEIAFLNRGTWQVLEDSKLSASTDLKNGTLFTLAKSKNIKADIGVYPNPTEGEFFLKLTGMHENEKIVVTIINQDGTTIMRKEGTVKDLRTTYELPEALVATELNVHVQRENNKSLVQKMILHK